MNKILLFVPMYNCEKQITRVLGQIDEEVLKYVDRVLVVNNRSTDNGESKVVEYCKVYDRLPVTLIRNDENYGGGGSHKVAFKYAEKNGYDYIIVLHGDDQGNIKDLIPYIKSGEALEYDAFLGSRFEKKSKLINYSKFRIFGNHVFNTFLSAVLRKRITDLGAGLNMYKVDFLKSGFYMYFINSLTFYVYFLIYIIHSNAKFKFFPLSWREDDQVSNAKFVKQSKEIIRITFGYIFHKNKTFSMDENEYSKIGYTSEVVYEQ